MPRSRIFRRGAEWDDRPRMTVVLASLAVAIGCWAAGCFLAARYF
jgi:hypothetical protein